MAVVAVAVFVGCKGETEPPTNLTPTSATVNALINCQADLEGEYWFEIAYDPGNTGIWTFSQVGPQWDFNCPPDQDPNTSGYQSGFQDVPWSYNITTASGWLQQCKGYVYRLRARIHAPGQPGNSYYTWVDSNGIQKDNVYDEIPWNRANSNCPNGRL